MSIRIEKPETQAKAPAPQPSRNSLGILWSRRFRLLLACYLFVQTAVADDPMAIVQHAYQLQQSGEYAAAAEAYREFLKLRPDEVGAHSNLGVVLTKLGRFDEAIHEYEAADKLLPNDPRIVVNLALAYEKSGRLPEATKRLENLHSAVPQEKQVTMLLADAELQGGNNARVIQLLQPLEQQTPDDLAIAYLLGTALIREQRISEGQVVLDRILKNGDTAEARFLLGMQMFESRDYPEAVRQFAAASEVNARLPDLQAYYGQALLTTGDADGASAAFQRELEENPNSYAANLGLGQILTVRKHYGEAEPKLRQAFLMRPQSAEAALALGECLSGEGKWSEAGPLLHVAVKAMPNSVEAHKALADFYARSQLVKDANREKAIVERLQANSASPGPKQNQMAPDFTLADAATGKSVSLREFRGNRPAVLVFGSYTCPNFRDAAGALKSLEAKYGMQVPFLLIYIREAHGAGDWQSTRNERADVNLPQAKQLSDRQDHATMCKRSLHLPFPALLDGLDNKVEAQYGAWPSRAFVIDRDGRIRYSSRLTELDFSAAEMEAALRSVL